MGRKRVLVIEDHPLLRQELALMIGRQPDLECCAALTGTGSVVERVLAEKPDLVLADLSLGKRDGLEIIKQLKERRPRQSVLVFSGHDEPFYAERALAAGAMGYVNKRETPATLLTAIRRVLNGQVHLSKAMSDRLAPAAAQEAGPRAGSPMDTLTNRELQMLRLIGQGLDTRKIAGQLGLAASTVDTCRGRLRVKLALRTTRELIRYAALWAAARE